MSFAAKSRAPKDDTPIEEGVGHITSDSLAAESLNAGGSFANGHAAAESVPSHSTTANTTDTTGATILPPARDASSRADADADYNASLDRQHAATEGGMGASKPYDTAHGAPQESYGGAAPTSAYAGSGVSKESQKPKGRNIHEGGFSPDLPNASFNQHIADRKDPGRVAEQQMERANAHAGADAGYEGVSSNTGIVGGKGGFENLDAETSA